jgi:putative membrane protein insertion efficiency factor
MKTAVLVKQFLQKFGSLFCLSLIRTYQLLISPLLPRNCRFTPTCSQYAIDAIKRHGVWRGNYLAIRRLLRCHPFSRGGYDPVDP